MKETRRQRIERRIKEAYAKGRRDELRKSMRSCEVCDAMDWMRERKNESNRD